MRPETRSPVSNLQNKTVLVTGASGFIGRAVVAELLQTHPDTRVVAGLHRRPLDLEDPRLERRYADLRDPEACRSLCQGVHAVVHAAGGVGSAAVAGLAVMEGLVENLVLTSRLLQAAWECSVEKCLVFSSTTGYPLVEHPVEEDEMHTGPVPRAYWGYGHMRNYLERLGEFVSETSGQCQVVLVRPSAVYGPRDSFDPKRCHVIPALIRKAVEGQEPFEVWGTGTEVRDFLYVDDLARGALAALASLPGARPVNLASGEATTIREVTELILEAAGHRPAAIHYQTDRPVMIPFRRIDTRRAREEAGFQASVSLAEGLRRTVEWFRRECALNG